jgi:cytochrome c
VQTVEYEFWTPEWEELVRASKFADYPEYGRATRGHIGLQDHGHTLRYRNIKLRSIEP